MSSERICGDRITDGVVKPEWIDYNGHMNVAYYLLAFDLSGDDLWQEFGITDEYIRTTNNSTFAVECHITYQRELKEGEPYCVTSQVLAYDEKRIHFFQRMYHAEEKYLAATAEWMNLHVDLESRRVSEWPEDILKLIAGWVRQQKRSDFPREAGQRMRVRKPLYSLSESGRP